METEKQLEDTLQGQEVQEETSQEETSQEVSSEQPVTEGEKKEVAGEASPATVEVLGRQYDLSKPDQVQELIKDYDRLGRMYSPLLQQVRELQTQLQALHEKEEAKPEEEIDETTLNYLKKAIEKLNVVTEEKLRQVEEERRLEDYLSSLEAEYDGSNGLPKFDRAKVLEFCVQNGISDPLAGYKLMYFDQLVEAKLRQAGQTKTPPPSVPSAGERRIPQPKKRVFGIPSSDGEISLREAIEETLNEVGGELGEQE